MKQLTRFTVRMEGDGFIITLNFKDGATSEMHTEPDELDSVIDTLNRMIADDQASPA